MIVRIDPDRQSGVQAVKNVMQQYGGGGGQEGWDEVWDKHKKKVGNLVDKIMKKSNVTYHDLGNLALPEGQYTTLASGQAAPPEFEKLQSLMADIADQAQQNATDNDVVPLTPEETEIRKKHQQFMQPVYDEYWKKYDAIDKSDLPDEEKYKKLQQLYKWRDQTYNDQEAKFDWNTGKPKTESKKSNKPVLQSLTDKRKRINHKYFELEQKIWEDKSLTQEKRERKLSQLRMMKNKELKQL